MNEWFLQYKQTLGCQDITSCTTHYVKLQRITMSEAQAKLTIDHNVETR